MNLCDDSRSPQVEDENSLMRHLSMTLDCCHGDFFKSIAKKGTFIIMLCFR